MSKKVFINNLNTFVSRQLLAELRNDKAAGGEDGEEADNADANVIYGTYIDKDSSEKPPGIKKMLKVSQPAFIFFVTHANLSSFNRDPSPGLP